VLQLPVQLGLSARLFSSASQADKQPAHQQPKKEVCASWPQLQSNAGLVQFIKLIGSATMA
jgi:hypothetical protein